MYSTEIKHYSVNGFGGHGYWKHIGWRR